MKTTSKAIAGIALVAAALLTAGCGSTETPEGEQTTELTNGKTAYRTTIEGVDCVVLTSQRTAAITCNWEATND